MKRIRHCLTSNACHPPEGNACFKFFKFNSTEYLDLMKKKGEKNRHNSKCSCVFWFWCSHSFERYSFWINTSSKPFRSFSNFNSKGVTLSRRMFCWNIELLNKFSFSLSDFHKTHPSHDELIINLQYNAAQFPFKMTLAILKFHETYSTASVLQIPSIVWIVNACFYAHNSTL